MRRGKEVRDVKGRIRERKERKGGKGSEDTREEGSKDRKRKVAVAGEKRGSGGNG